MRIRSSLALAAIASLAVAAPVGAATTAGTYKGITNQNLPFSIVVKRNAIRVVKFAVKNSCGAAHKPIDVEGGTIPIEAGTFTVSLRNARGSLTISGAFGGGYVKGTLREKARSSAGATCDTGKVRFAAKRR